MQPQSLLRKHANSTLAEVDNLSNPTQWTLDSVDNNRPVVVAATTVSVIGFFYLFSGARSEHTLILARFVQNTFYVLDIPLLRRSQICICNGNLSASSKFAKILLESSKHLVKQTYKHISLVPKTYWTLLKLTIY